MIIDSHMHAFADEIVQKAMEVLSSNAGITPYYDGSVKGLISYCKKNGVDKAVVVPIATKPSQVEVINRWAISLKKHSLIIPFGTIHYDYFDIEKELSFLKENGIVGIKMHPEYQSFYPDEEKMFPIYEALVRNNMAMIFHAGEDIVFEDCHSSPDRFLRVRDLFPKLKIILAHLGGFRQWDDVERFIIGRDFYIETSFSIGYMDIEQFRRILLSHGSDKVFFGSDGPWGDQLADIKTIRELDISGSLKEAIFYRNFLKFMHSLEK